MTKIIILAAGKGERMGSQTSKVLVPLKNRPIIEYLLDSVSKSKVDECPIIVVSPDNKKEVSEKLNQYNLSYAIQKEQLGTGHAVTVAEDQLLREIEKVIILYGDHPFIKSDSIKKLAGQDIAALTIMPTKLPDFKGWRQNFYHWGRIVRNSSGEVEKIVEFKDAPPEEKEILEVNPGIMAFNRKWLFDNISKLKNDNNQQEYYLTDMVKLAFSQGFPVTTINIEPEEAIGINSREELAIAATLL